MSDRPDFPINGRTLEEWRAAHQPEIERYLMGVLKRFLGTKELAKQIRVQYEIQKVEDARAEK